MKVKRLISDILDSNVYVVEKGDEAIIVDCGCKAIDVEKELGDKKVVAILLTHGHFDHSKYCNEYAKKFNAKIYANKNITQTLSDSEAIYSDDGFIIDDYSNFELIEKDCILKLGNFEVECFACGGHCKCCECYLIEGNLFAGDVLFERSIGRTDLKGSSREEMYSSLCKLENLTFDRAYSGHGEDTSWEEQQKNIKVYKRFLKR